MDVFLNWEDAPADQDAVAETLRAALSTATPPATLRRVTVGLSGQIGARANYLTFRPVDGGLTEDRLIRGLHPLVAQRLDFGRLVNFDLTRLPADEGIYLFNAVGKENAEDERLIALGEILDVHPLRDAAGRVLAVPTVERVLSGCLEGIRSAQARRPAKRRLDCNRIVLSVAPTAIVPMDELHHVVRGLVPMTAGAGLEEVMVVGRLQESPDAPENEVAVRISYQHGAGVQFSITERPTEPLPPMDEYTQKVRRARARGTLYPYELIGMLAGPGGSFTELDLDATGKLVEVDREPGRNTAGGRGGPRHAGDGAVPGRHDPGRPAGRPDEGARFGRRAGVLAHLRGAGPRRGPRDPGRVVRALVPAPGSRWTPAPRTWTGSPGRCVGSSRSRRRAARSTSSSRASTSAPSRTGTPRPRCSCTPRESW